MGSETVDSGPAYKVEEIRRLLERRIRYGDYLGKEFPPERNLAEETGVSRMTARKAVQRLVEQGLLLRQDNGRVVIGRGDGQGTLRVAFLLPTLLSQDVERWRTALERAATRFGATVRSALYMHWDDPVLLDALDACDGVFLNPNSEPIPDRIAQRLRSAGRGLVVLGRDLSAMGIPSVDLFPAFFIQRLLDHLAELGHRRVDCFNVQTMDPVIEQRVKQWHLWRATHRIDGELLNEPIRPYVETPVQQAYEAMGRLLDAGRARSGALFCTTAPAAIGAVRAMRDRGVAVGRDASVCVINDEGLGRFMSPSLTSIEMPDPEPYLATCIEWMRRAGEGWVGSLLLQPPQPSLFIGESTGPRVGILDAH